jgi:tetratricopeptide (TPR) repeat protein/glycosyltransferase involved in cell wall biosynthesis
MSRRTRRFQHARRPRAHVVSPNDPMLAAALEIHQSGRLSEAEALYRQVLRTRPADPEALHLSGLLAFQMGDQDQAVQSIRKAIAINERAPTYHSNLALALRAQGRIEEAAASLKRALALKEDYPEAQHNLGVVLLDLGRRAEAIAHFRRAIALKPDYADAYSALGLALREDGQGGDAMANLHRAAELMPENADAHHNLAVALAELGRHDEALASFQDTIRLNPNHLDAHNNLGCLLRELGDPDGAVACFQRTVELRPDHVEALNNLGVALGELGRKGEGLAALRRATDLKPDYDQAVTNLAVALSEQGLLDEALATLQRAIEIQPENADAHNNLGVVFKKQRKLDDAVASFQRAVDCRPNYAQAHSNLGVALGELERFEEALVSLQRAVALKPDFADGHNNLAGGFRNLNRTDEALASAERALALKPTYRDALHNLAIIQGDQDRLEDSIATLRRIVDLTPDHPEGHFGLALALLFAGEFEEGLVEYEWRWRCADFATGRPQFAKPEWDGSPLDGRTILVSAEQGLGDTLQFARFIPRLAASGGRVILMCQRELIRLLQSLECVHELVERGQPLPEFDVHVPLASLPYLFGTRLDTIPASAQYLRADPDLVADWSEKLPVRRGMRVGIVWGGNPDFKNDRRRSITLDLLAPLARVPGVQLIALQKGSPAAQAATPPEGMSLANLGPMLTDFADTAAVLEQLDLVITVDTSVAHLAGALGRPVWILLHSAPDWRWLRYREDSPWYPSVRLFRQHQLGDWRGVIERVQGALAEVASTVGPQHTVAGSPPLSAEPVLSAPIQTQNGAVHAVRSPLETNGRHTSANGVHDSAPRRPSTPPAPVYLAVSLDKGRGWNVRARYLAKELSLLREVRLVTDDFDAAGIGDELESRFLKEIACDAETSAPAAARVLQAIRYKDLHPERPGLKGEFNVGYAALPENILSPAAVEHARIHFDVVVAGSTWCKDVLEAHGMREVRTVLQGIDPTLFHPSTSTAAGRFKDRFVVFSGGKFEFRKGQDIVIRAFKVLQERHKDVLLVNAWFNPEEANFNSMRPSPLIRFSPWAPDYADTINHVLTENDVDVERVVTLGAYPHALMPKIYADTDVGVFPSRCEGATNLALMEYMACGKPVIASYTSGHRDIVNSHNAVLIRNMKSITLKADDVELAMWEDPDLDETIAHLEWAYQNRDRLRGIGARAGEDLAKLTWKSTAEQLNEILSLEPSASAIHNSLDIENPELRSHLPPDEMAGLQQRIAREYRVGDDLPAASAALLDPLRRSQAYRAIRDRVASDQPSDSWEQDGLHLFVFQVLPADGAVLPEPPVAVFTMHPELAEPLSAVLVTPRPDGAEAEIVELCDFGAGYVAPIAIGTQT